MLFETKLKFGQIVRDKISLFTGKIRAFNHWDNGCVKIGVQGEVKDGKIPDCEWIDEQQIEIIKDVEEIKRKSLGGGSLHIIESKIPMA